MIAVARVSSKWTFADRVACQAGQSRERSVGRVMLEIRPMRAEDVFEAENAWHTSFSAMREAYHLSVEPRTTESVAAVLRRREYLRGTDPGGSWVAQAGEVIVGLAQAHLRGDVWVLATLGVHPEFQDRHVGRDLLDHALALGDGVSKGAIFSSPDHRAMSRYVTAGFTLQPTVSLHGPRSHDVEFPSGVRAGHIVDLGHVAVVDAMVRGRARTQDIEFLMHEGLDLLVAPGRGYAVTRGGRVVTLSAIDEETAVILLRAVISQCPVGEPVEVSWVTPRQQWAITVGVEAGVALHVHGAVMTRGEWEPDRPYLPHGIFG
jgi:hypothetical protein